MGKLDFFSLDKYKNIDIFIETGTGMGVSLNYALQFPFKQFYSIEYVFKLYNIVSEKYKDNQNVKIMHGVSWEILKIILPNIANYNCLFWLDAHLPGVDYNEPVFVEDENINMPLLKELEVINMFRQNHRDVILIDDLRFYSVDNFESGNLPKEWRRSGYEDIVSIFKKTHVVNKYVNSEGYIEIIPKELVGAYI